MPEDFGRSIGDDATLAGAAKCPPSSEASLGDERTLGGGNAGGLDTVIGDIEVVDLESRYQIEGTLGQGGMGAVLLATDTRLDRKVAIKRILGESARSKAAIARFLTEARSIAALNHPNIVQIYDYGRAKDGPFLIMEYVAGGSLLDRCRDSALPLDEAIDLACQLCDGLAKAHDLGIIHRDIKPANVLLTKDGTPKLTDFGLAKAEVGDHGQTMTGAVLGTPDFMPPEQRRDASLVDHRSDLWSLAATVYQMVIGRSPKVIRLHELPQALQAVMARALEDAKDARYQSAREFRDALKTGLRSAAPAAAVTAVGDGQCPACGVQNDGTRKFCRGCGASLFAPCLECTQPMPIWDDICGSCGATQTPLVETKRADMATAQAKAEGLLGDFEFDKAAALVTALRDEPNPRLVHLKPWAEQFLQEIDKGRQEQLARAAAAATEALTHEKAFDYAAGIRALEPLPQAVRMLKLPALEGTAGEVLHRLDQKLRAAKSMETAIRDAIKSKAMSGLLEKVIALAKLRPDRADIVKLRTQLETRQGSLAKQRDTLLRQAQQAMEKQDYAAALKILSQVDADVVNFDVGKLHTDAQQREERINALRDQIKVAISETRYSDVLKLSDEYLTLKPMTPDLERIRAQAGVEVRRAATRKRWNSVAVMTVAVSLICSWIGMQAYRDAKEKHLAAIEAAKVKYAADLEAALKAGAWDDVLALESENVAGLIGRARAKLKESPPDVTGAFSDLEQAERGATNPSRVAAALADAYAVRATESASADNLEDAAEDLKRAESSDSAAPFIAAAKSSFAKGWIRRMEQTGAAGDTAALQAASAAAIKAGADFVALRSVWEGFAAARLQSLDAEGLATACSEIAQLNKLKNNEGRLSRQEANVFPGDEDPLNEQQAEWWLQFGILGVERAEEPAVLTAAAAWAEVQSTRRSQSDIERVEKPSRPSPRSSNVTEEVQFPTPPEYPPQSAAALWRLQAEACVGRVNVKGLATACREGLKHGMPEQDIAALWLRLGNIAAEPPHLDPATAQTAVAEAKAAGASQRDVAALNALALMADATLSFAQKDVADAITKVTEAALADSATTATALGWPNNGDLRIAVTASYSKRARQAFAANDWEMATKFVAAARAVDPDVTKWVLEELANHPGGLAAVPAAVSGRLPPDVIALGSNLRNSVGIEMKLLPAGSFTMGQADGPADERPHRVMLERAFYIGLYEVTNAQWRQVMRLSKSESPNHPVIGVNWDQATEFCRRLSAMPEEKKMQRVYRLPTEAEWEYACRAGTTTTYSFGDNASRAWEHGWFSENSGIKPHPVGHKKPNAWGLFDMQGNAKEWCSDRYAEYESSPVRDPRGPLEGFARVLRGQSYNTNGTYSHSARRHHESPSDNYGNDGPGFRLALSPPESHPKEAAEP